MSHASTLPVRTRLAARAGLVTAALSRSLGRGEGSVIGGRVTIALDRASLRNLAHGRTVVLVSGTNGKTTTTSMLAAAMRTIGSVVTNGAGSNMFGGMVNALAASDADLVVLETDEAHLPRTISETDPRFVVLLNLSRDQLDRVGEVRMQAQKWRQALEGAPATTIANADDPLVVWAAERATRVVWVAAGTGWRLDAASCPNCGGRIDWTESDWRCSACALRRPERESLYLSWDGTVPLADDPVALPLDLRLPGEVNQRNAAMALAASVIAGANADEAARAIATVEAPGGRFMSASVGEHAVRLVLAKNPAGWTEALRIARPVPSPLVVGINARVQDGRDPSWLWDVDFEQLRGRLVVATGDRGRDLAVRLRYADVEHRFVADLGDAVSIAAERATGEFDVLGNYSAFQDYRRIAR